jgi:hypothetical protein
MSDNIEVAPEAPVEAPIEPTDVEGQAPSSDAAPSDETEAAEQSAFEELAAKKGFKDADAMAQAYANLESKNTQIAQSRAELLRNIDSQMEQPAPEPQTQPVEEDGELAQLLRPHMEPMMTQLREQQGIIRQLSINNAINEVSGEFPEVIQQQETVLKFLRNRPDMLQDMSRLSDNLRLIGAAVRGSLNNANISKAKEEGRTEAYKNQTLKTQGGPQGTGKGKSSIGQDEISKMLDSKDIPLSEIEKLLPSA